MVWNPNAPDPVGLEWHPTRQGSSPIDAATRATLQRIPSTVAQTIGSVRVYMPGGVGGRYWLEVYDEDNALGGVRRTDTFRPNEDVTDGLWTNQVGSQSNMFQAIDEVTLDVNDVILTIIPDDFLGLISTNAYEGRFGVGVGNLAGQRVLSVNLYGVVLDGYTGDFGLNIGGSRFLANTFGTTSREDLFEIEGFNIIQLGKHFSSNPLTGRPWTIAEVESLDTTNEFVITAGDAFSVTQQGQYFATAVVAQFWVEIISIPENRVAVGAADAAALPAWVSFPIFTPAGVANWSKPTAPAVHEYLLRRAPNAVSGSASHRFLDSGVTPPGDLESFLPALDDEGVALAYGDARTRAYSVIPFTTAPAASVDSQAYAELRAAEVYDGHAAEQEISGVSAAVDYQAVIALIRPQTSTIDDLEIRVRVRSSGVQVGDTITVTPEEVRGEPDAGNGWRRFQANALNDYALAAVQHYLEFTSAAPDLASRWEVVALGTLGASEATASFGGTTDVATLALAGEATAEDQTFDLVAMLTSIPDAPADAVVVLGSQDLPGGGTGCLVASIERGQITWTATSLAAAFARYELDRSLNGGESWERIMKYTLEADEQFNDYEIPVGLTGTFRLRVIRDPGGVASLWVPVAGSVTLDPACHELRVVSNERPELNVAYNYPPGVEFELPSEDEVVLRRIYGRQGSVAFRPLEEEEALVEFALDLRVFAADGLGTVPPDGKGIAAFDRLRAIARCEDCSYAAVLDHVGGRFFSELRVPNVQYRDDTDLYVGRVRVTELTRVPSTPTRQ